MSYKFLDLNTFEEIEQKFLTRFPKYSFRQPPAFVNYNNTQYLLGGKGNLISNANEVDCF